MQASKRSVKAQQGSGSIGSSLSAGLEVYLSKCRDPYVSPGCTISLAFFRVFLSCFKILILSLPVLGLGSKSNSLSLGSSERRPSQYFRICWKSDLISQFFVFFLVLLYFVVSRSQSLDLGGQNMMAVMSASLFFPLFFLSLVTLTRSYQFVGIVVSVV